MPTWRFRIGDVFDPQDPLAVWICSLAVALNDAIHANLKVEAASTPWGRFYEWRIAISHFNEACLHLERGRELEAVKTFLAEEPKLEAAFEGALAHYDSVRRLANRVRNQAAFHYAYKSGQRAVARALGELQNAEGSVGGTVSTKMRDSRQLYADEVVAQLVFIAAGGTEVAYEEAAARFGEAVAAFARFANAALDAYFWRHRDALRLDSSRTGDA